MSLLLWFDIVSVADAGWLVDRDDQDAGGRGVYVADEPGEEGEVSGVCVLCQKGGGGVVSFGFCFWSLVL